jgi:pimeloyl-ACP methyl ester carboxylesterase
VGPLLDIAAERFDVVAHDQRGLGRTSIPPGPYTMADYAADAAAVLDSVGWEQARVMGISFGGMVAQELAVTWPERVSRLALLCTSPGGAGGASYPLHKLAGLPDEERAAALLGLTDTRYTPEFLAEHPRDQAIAEMMAQRRRGSTDPEVRRGELAQLEARLHHDVTDRLANIDCPTLVACGRYDGIAPVSNGEAIAAGCRGPSCGSTRAATSSCCRTARRCPRSSTSWPGSDAAVTSSIARPDPEVVAGVEGLTPDWLAAALAASSGEARIRSLRTEQVGTGRWRRRSGSTWTPTREHARSSPRWPGTTCSPRWPAWPT